MPDTINGSSNLSVSRQHQRQSFNVRLPADVYFGDWQRLHNFVARYTGDGRRVSNSILVRLAIWALNTLHAQAGPEGLDELGKDLAQVAQQAAARKRGPNRSRSTSESM